MVRMNMEEEKRWYMNVTSKPIEHLRKIKYMEGLNEWLTQTKTDVSELKDFISDIESFFSDTGFNTIQYEKVLEAKLKAFQDEVRESLKTESDVED